MRASGATAKVYPRVCGGTRYKGPPDYNPGGLSPRVRGNPWEPTGPYEGPGSIPACAGEPLPRP